MPRAQAHVAGGTVATARTPTAVRSAEGAAAAVGVDQPTEQTAGGGARVGAAVLGPGVREPAPTPGLDAEVRLAEAGVGRGEARAWLGKLVGAVEEVARAEAVCVLVSCGAPDSRGPEDGTGAGERLTMFTQMARPVFVDQVVALCTRAALVLSAGSAVRPLRPAAFSLTLVLPAERVCAAIVARLLTTRTGLPSRSRTAEAARGHDAPVVGAIVARRRPRLPAPRGLAGVLAAEGQRRVSVAARPVLLAPFDRPVAALDAALAMQLAEPARVASGDEGATVDARARVRLAPAVLESEARARLDRASMVPTAP